jgi:hypothetical protein
VNLSAPEYHHRAMRTDLNEALRVAIAAERAAWDKVKSGLPGTPRFQAELWAAWQAAVQRCVDIRRAIDAEAASHATRGPAGG